jgi:phospholipid/cholesterol/gamma-HCH transport system ATP-binding protein
MFTITLEGVSMMRGDTEIISGVSCTFREGTVTALLGFSGSGKSTLLKLAAGLLLPSSGSVLIDGVRLDTFSRGDEEAFRKVSGFIFQDAALWANRTVFQNIAFPLQLHFPEMPDAAVRQRVMECVEAVGYQDRLERRPSQISAGEQKMVSIARAVAARPEILFIDSPLLNLDSVAEARIIALLKSLKQEGTAMMVSSSSSPLVSLLADRLLIIDNGRIVEEGSFAEVRSSSHPVTKSVLASILEQASSYDDEILDLLGDL